MKINCTNPSHNDADPSMTVYSDHGYCHACGYVDWEIKDEAAVKPEPTNIQEEIKNIRENCEIRTVRGLELHQDTLGYYVLWPDSSFFKKRLYGGKSRYMGPRGHQAPMFVYPVQGATALVLTEGEINCMSLHEAFPDHPFTLASFGSASEIKKAIDLAIDFKYTLVIVDRDAAGVAAGVWFKKELLKRGKQVQLEAVETDFNETLEKEGSEGVRKQFYEILGMQRRLPGKNNTL